MIKSIKHKGLKRFYESGNTSGIQASHAKRLSTRLTRLEAAQDISYMDVPGYDLHLLKGDRANTWSLSVSGNWRLTFEFRDSNAYVVNYEDYH